MHAACTIHCHAHAVPACHPYAATLALLKLQLAFQDRHQVQYFKKGRVGTHGIPCLLAGGGLQQGRNAAGLRARVHDGNPGEALRPHAVHALHAVLRLLLKRGLRHHAHHHCESGVLACYASAHLLPWARLQA